MALNGKPQRWLPGMISRCGHQASWLCMQAKHYATIIPLGTQLEHLQWPHAASGRPTEYGLGGLGMPPYQLASGRAAPGIAHLPPKVHTCCSRPCADFQHQDRGDTRRCCLQDMSKPITLVLIAASSCVWLVSECPRTLGMGLPSPLSLMPWQTWTYRHYSAEQ